LSALHYERSLLPGGEATCGFRVRGLQPALCGDPLTLYVTIDGDRLAGVSRSVACASVPPA